MEDDMIYSDIKDKIKEFIEYMEKGGNIKKIDFFNEDELLSKHLKLFKFKSGI
jgi:hypothetical protein